MARFNFSDIKQERSHETLAQMEIGPSLSLTPITRKKDWGAVKVSGQGLQQEPRKQATPTLSLTPGSPEATSCWPHLLTASRVGGAGGQGEPS